MRTESREERAPLATFILVSFNQERYVDEAVDAAFSQTYSPLEIILSDDCSSDRTFQIMCDKVDAYKGPHKVIVRQNPRNLGLLEHLNVAAAEAASDHIILAAGDDISFPERTERLMEIFRQDPRRAAIFTNFVSINERSEIVGNCAGPEAARPFSATELLLNGGGAGFGATYAYAKRCFSWLGPLPGNILSEDRILPLRAALIGNVYFSSQALLRYRRLPGSVGHAPQNRGLLGFNHPEHWRIIGETLRAAKREGLVGGFRSAYLMTLFRSVQIATRLQAAGAREGSRAKSCLGKLAFQALRVPRFASRFRHKYG